MNNPKLKLYVAQGWVIFAESQEDAEQRVELNHESEAAQWLSDYNAHLLEQIKVIHHSK